MENILVWSKILTKIKLSRNLKKKMYSTKISSTKSKIYFQGWEPNEKNLKLIILCFIKNVKKVILIQV